MPQTELADESSPISAAARADHRAAIGAQGHLEDGLEALAIELRTHALSDKTHSGPSLWQCESEVTAYWTQVLLPQLHFIFRCNVHS